MARSLQPMDDKEPEKPRIMPTISPDKYLAPVQQGGVTVQQKTTFLEKYYETGNQSMAAKFSLIADVRYALKVDPAFMSDFLTIKNAQKHNLEQTMYQNGLKEKGYMDRITWLRKNFPKEYNPNYVDKENNPADAIKELSSKLNEYQLIPKNKIIEGEVE